MLQFKGLQNFDIRLEDASVDTDYLNQVLLAKRLDACVEILKLHCEVGAEDRTGPYMDLDRDDKTELEKRMQELINMYIEEHDRSDNKGDAEESSMDEESSEDEDEDDEDEGSQAEESNMDENEGEDEVDDDEMVKCNVSGRGQVEIGVSMMDHRLA